MSRTLPYWRLSGYYLFYFSTVGVFLPFWNLYLESLGFSPAQIGELAALLVVGKIISPYLWGWIADRNGRRVKMIRLAASLSCLVFIGALFATSYSVLAMVMFVFGFFWSASLPLFEVITHDHLGTDTHGYARIRLWGSVGFVVTVVVLGIALEYFGIKPLPWIVFIAVIGIWTMTMLLPDDVQRVDIRRAESIFEVMKQPVVIAMMAVFFFMQAGHGAYYSFYSIYLESYGYSRSVIGQLWALGVIAEVGIFLLMYRLLQRFSVAGLLLFSMLSAAVRWFLIAQFPENPAVIVFAQILHGLTFGLHHAVAMQLILRYFKGTCQGRGQALYSAFSFGAGGAAGALISGYVWEGLGAVDTFRIAGLISIIGAAVVWKWFSIENENRRIN